MSDNDKWHMLLTTAGKMYGQSVGDSRYINVLRAEDQLMQDPKSGRRIAIRTLLLPVFDDVRRALAVNANAVVLRCTLDAKKDAALISTLDKTCVDISARQAGIELPPQAPKLIT